MGLATMKSLYSTSYCQASSSPKDALLAVGNSEGKIVVFDLKNVNSSRVTGIGERLKGPLHIASAHSDAVYSMVATPTFCISGTTGVIAGRRWSDLRNRQSQPSWSISLECDQGNFGTPEVNGLSYEKQRGVLYAACGDWRTHVYDLESGKRIQTLEGHDDYVHDVVANAGGTLVASCGEDGKVLMWDPRAGREPRHRLSPHTHEQLGRPYLGRFITSIDIYNDWVLCGGGPRAGIFHLRSLALTTVLPPAKSIVHVTKFTGNAEGGDRGGIIVAGVSSNLSVCSMAGEVTAQMPSSSPCIYTANVTEKPFTMLTYGGMSSKIDVCFNLNYRDHSVSLMEN